MGTARQHRDSNWCDETPKSRAEPKACELCRNRQKNSHVTKQSMSILLSGIKAKPRNNGKRDHAVTSPLPWDEN